MKKFPQLKREFPDLELSASKVSMLSYKEKRAVAKKLYPHYKDTLSNYQRMDNSTLSNKVWKVMKARYN